MNSALRVRLRTQNGDLGPVDAAGTDTVGELKSKLLTDWSRLTAGKLGAFLLQPVGSRPCIIFAACVCACTTQVPGQHTSPCTPASTRHCHSLADAKVESEAPTSVACIKLILNGKFLDNDEVLAGEVNGGARQQLLATLQFRHSYTLGVLLLTPLHVAPVLQTCSAH